MNKIMGDKLPVSQSQYKRLLDSLEKLLIVIVVEHPDIKLLNVGTRIKYAISVIRRDIWLRCVRHTHQAPLGHRRQDVDKSG